MCPGANGRARHRPPTAGARCGRWRRPWPGRRRASATASGSGRGSRPGRTRRCPGRWGTPSFRPPRRGSCGRWRCRWHRPRSRVATGTACLWRRARPEWRRRRNRGSRVGPFSDRSRGDDSRCERPVRLLPLPLARNATRSRTGRPRRPGRETFRPSAWPVRPLRFPLAPNGNRPRAGIAGRPGRIAEPWRVLALNGRLRDGFRPSVTFLRPVNRASRPRWVPRARRRNRPGRRRSNVRVRAVRRGRDRSANR